MMPPKNLLRRALTRGLGPQRAGGELRNYHALVSLVAILLLACMIAGCAARVQHVTNLPPGVTEQEVKNWDGEVAALHKIAGVVSSLRQGVIDLNKVGAFPDSGAYIKFLQSIGKVDQLEQAAAEYLKATPKTFGAPQKDKVKSSLTEIATELNSLNEAGLLNVKNSKTKDQVAQFLAEAIAALNLGLSFTN
jgi:hypothetical protein